MRNSTYAHCGTKTLLSHTTDVPSGKWTAHYSQDQDSAGLKGKTNGVVTNYDIDNHCGGNDVKTLE